MPRWFRQLSLTIRPGNVGEFAFVTVVMLALLACQPSERARSVPGLRDDLGRVVSLTGSARRIVSLSPATTELLFAIGAGDRLVGRTQWDDVPPEARSVASVGEGMPPNVEAVVAVNPDLVVLYASEVNRGPLERFGRLGIQAIGVRLDLLQRLPHVAELLGAATGLKERANDVADTFRTKLDSAAASQAVPGDAARVVILTWDNPPIVIGAGSFLHELLTLAGARNAFADIAAPSATVSIEAIAERDPDVFLVTTGAEVPAYAQRPEWRTLRAISQGRFALVEGTEFQWPSMRSLDAVPRLRAAIGAAAANPPARQGAR